MRPLYQIFVFLLLFSSAAFAADPLIHKDWMVNQGPDEVFLKDSCLAATNAITGARAQLLLSFTKDKLNVPQLTLKVWDTPNPEAQLLIKVSNKISYPLFLWKAATQPDQPDIYWYAPIGWAPLLDFIAAANTLEIQGNTLKFQVSLKGSSAAVSDMKTCLKADSVLPLDFLSKINTKTDLDAAVYGSVDELIKGIEDNFSVYRDGLAKTAEHKKLLAGSAKLLAQEQAALDVYKPAQARWVTAKANLDAQTQKQQQLQTTLAQAQKDLSDAQAELVIAQADALKKKNIYDPVYAQVLPFMNDVSTKQSNLANNINRTQRLIHRIAELQDEIPSLENERARLRKKVSSLQSDLNQARNDYNRALSNTNNYNVEYEFQKELSNDYIYRFARDDFDRAHRDYDQADNRSRQAQLDLLTAEGRLNACRNRPQPPTVPPAPPPPPPNCFMEEQDVSRANDQVRKAESDKNSASSSMDFARFRMNNEADSVRRKVQSTKDDLDNAMDKAKAVYDDLNNQVSDANDRIHDIDNTLPDDRNELASAQAEVPQLQSLRPGLEKAFADSQTALKNKKIELDFDRIEAEYKAANDLVAATKKSINDNTLLISKTTKSLKNIQPVIADLTKELNLQTQKRDAAAQKLAPIQEALKPMRAQEEIINKAIADLAAQFELAKSRYQKTYQRLITPVPVQLQLNQIVIGSF